MRASWKTWVGLTVAAAALVFFFTLYKGRPEAAPVSLEASRVTDDWIKTVRERAQTGYWLVVRGTHIGDQVVAAGSAGELTHAAVYDAAHDDVIEAVGTGVHRLPARELLAQAYRLQIIRPRSWDPEAGQAAVERASSHCGYRYDWLGTIGIQSDSRYYCTELALDAYRARERGWMPPGVIHPVHMVRYGELVFDSGPRASESEALRASDELRARFARRLEDARGMAYAAEVAPGIYRGGQPDAQGIEWLRARGVRTVINLRHYHGDSEGDLVKAAGMRYERLGLESTDRPAQEQIDRFLALVGDPAARPVYVHCLHGVDRTGAMMAVYRIANEGWASSDALAEMEHFGAHGILHDLRRFVAGFTPAKPRQR